MKVNGGIGGVKHPQVVCLQYPHLYQIKCHHWSVCPFLRTAYGARMTRLDFVQCLDGRID